LGKTPGGGVVLLMPDAWARRLAGLPTRLEELLGQSGSIDCVVGRLFPKFSDDPDIEREMREVAEAELRERKLATVRAFAQMLAKGESALLRQRRMKLTAPQAEQWIACLNDLRLMLGTLLGIEENDAPRQLARGRPSIESDAWLYLLLTELQGGLIEVLDGE
jgi:hypothetical protein